MEKKSLHPLVRMSLAMHSTLPSTAVDAMHSTLSLTGVGVRVEQTVICLASSPSMRASSMKAVAR